MHASQLLLCMAAPVCQEKVAPKTMMHQTLNRAPVQSIENHYILLAQLGNHTVLKWHVYQCYANGMFTFCSAP